MNIIYKSKWSESTGTWVACSELVRGKTKNNCSKIVLALALALASFSTYAACNPISNTDADYPDIQATAGDQCSLDPEQTYNRITAKQGAKISGTNITSDGPKKGSGSVQSISLVGNSELEADNVTTTNRRPGSLNQAFYQNKSKSTIHQDLKANNTGMAAGSEIVRNINGSTLDIGGNLIIKDDSTTGSSYNSIYNENSQINVNGDINIDNTGVTDSTSNANTAIHNVGGKISANNVVIKQNRSASSISQQSKGDPDTLIDIKGNLDIDSTTSLSSIVVEGGKISVGKNTNIIKKALDKDTAAIGITNGGTFESKGDTTMTINSADTSETDLTATGVSIGDDSKFINHGNLNVNNGQNTVIASDEDLADGEIATFDNTTTAKTSSAVDTVVHKGRGTLVVNNDGILESTNNEKGSVLSNRNEGVLEATNSNILSGNINNNSNGKIVLHNTGKVNEDGEGATNPNQILNGGTGNIAITNDNTMGGNIINKGSLGSTDNISVENNKNLTSHIQNDGAGSILVNNNASSNLSGNIENTQSGTITLNNKGNVTSKDIKNTDIGAIELKNLSDTSKFNSNITNSSNGKITLDNSGIVNEDAEGSPNPNQILNGGTGSIAIINNNAMGGNIINKGGLGSTDNISVENNKNLTSHIQNDGNGSILVKNNATGNISGSISNSSTGAIKIVNDNILGGTITNTGDASTSAANNIDIINKRKITGNITNLGTGSIQVTNKANGELEGDISNESSGMISLINYGDIDNQNTNVNNGSGKIENLNNGTLKITNNNTMSRAFDNKGTGTLIVDNNGQINGNKISNNDEGTLEIHNNLKGQLDSQITNAKKGNIRITNDDTLGGFIANLGERIGSDENNIQIINRKTLTSTISNDASGAIKISNESSGTLSGKIINNHSGKISLINQGISSPNQIINSENGEVSVFNNYTLQTDVTNDATSSGLISFSNTANFEGNLVNANSGTISGVNTGNFIGTTRNSGFAQNGKIDLDNQGTWTNTDNSVLTNLTNSKGIIKFPQIPSTDAADKNKYHSITVKGDYTGGGQMYVNTFWNKDGTTYSDRVDIAGNVIGNKPTTVHTANEKGIYGDVIQKDIPIHSAVVVHVDGQTTGNDFIGKAPTTNAGEAQLEKINITRADGSAGTDYAWTLKAKGKTDPDKPNPPEVPIYAEPVSGYVQMPTADMELGFTTIGTLHERRSENQTYNITGNNNTALGEDQQQTWARVVVKHLDKDGKKRLGTAGNQSVIQIGHDFILDENDKNSTRRHVGGYVAYGHNENDFRDQYRAENGRVVDDHYNGKGRTDAVSVGGYGTFYGVNGGYVDLVGQVTYLRNKYSARSNDSEHQNGWGAALSAETGKSFIVYGNNWFIEPQAQLVYQYLSLDDFNDRIRHVDQHAPSALRGRIGMRLGYNDNTTDNLPPSSFYGVANIWHDFVNPKSVDIGRDSLKEKYAKTWGELGLGIQLPITRQSDFYGDVRYEKNFGSDKRKGFKGTMGYKYTWL